MTDENPKIDQVVDTLPAKLGSRKLRTKIAKIRRVLLGRYLWFTRIVVLAVLVLAIIGVGDFFIRQITDTSTGEYLRLGKMFLFPNNEAVKSVGGRTNILILGKGGGSHEAPDLTDTMIFASISHSKPQEVDLISLPRDIWIPESRSKLNSLYYWGNQQQTGGGLVMAKSSVEEIVGQQVHYAVVFDFEGFNKIIDILSGVDVEVEKGFTDKRFPIRGKENDLCNGDREYNCRYETIIFEPGIEHMDGERALKYVRSRQSEDLESGTDFARAQRQRKVIDAVIKKMTSREVVASPSKLREIFETVQENMETDLSEESMSVLARRAYQARNNLQSHNIPEELLVVPPYSREYDNLYVFIPASKEGDLPSGEASWSQVQQWVRDTL